MSSFKIYLPSNASLQHYPSNKPSCFTTQFVNPIQLEGNWQVGVESIYYNSDIGNAEETGTVDITYNYKKQTLVNDLYHVKYKLTEDRKWDYGWRQMLSIPSNDHKQPQLFEKALNSMNTLVVRNPKEIAFQFKVNIFNSISYITPYEGFYIRLSNKMAKVLGRSHHIHLSRNGRTRQHLGFRDYVKMKKDDWSFKIFNRHVVQKEKSIVLKERGVPPLSKVDFLQQWEQQITKPYGIQAKFVKGDKLIIINSNANMTLVLHQYLQMYCHHPEALISSGEFWPNNEYGKRSDNVTYVVNHDDIEWVIEVYKDDLSYTKDESIEKLALELMPRKYYTETLLAEAIETQVNEWLTKYTNERIGFEVKERFTHLTLPKDMTLKLSSNLQLLFGYECCSYSMKGTYVSQIAAAMLDKREQELYIHVDVVNQTNYGTSKNQILQHFIHNMDKNYGVVERRFQPILYLPVIRNFIESISVKILNLWNDCVYMKDSKTILVLHFRKV